MPVICVFEEKGEAVINDPILDEIYAIRERLAAQYSFDVLALGQSYIAHQKAGNCPIVVRRPKPAILEEGPSNVGKS